MSNILTARVTICGVRPLLWHAFGVDAIPLEKRERSGVAGNDPTEWRRTMLLTDTGNLYLPGTYVFGCLRDGARFTRRGRSTLQSAVTSTLQVRDERIVFADHPLPDPLPTDPTQPIYLDIRSVRNPMTKGRNIRYRVAAATGWRVAFDLQWDKTVVSRGELEAVVVDAGRLVGIGNGRQIGFGRFALQQFAVTGEA